MRSDAELIVASQADPRAFRELYDRWAVTLAGYFYRRVNDAEAAADLVAETFAVAYECRGRFRDVGKPGGGWLYGIARHQLMHYFHRRRVGLQAVQRLGIQVPQVDRESVAAIEALETAGGDHASLTDALLETPRNQRSSGRREATHTPGLRWGLVRSPLAPRGWPRAKLARSVRSEKALTPPVPVAVPGSREADIDRGRVLSTTACG